MTTVAQGLFQAVGRVSRSEARLLLATTIRKPKEFLIAHPEYSLTDEEVSLFDSCLQRAQAGEPQAARSLGSDLPDPMMYMFFLPITAIPDYAITDAGPVDYVALTTFDPVLEVVEK